MLGTLTRSALVGTLFLLASAGLASAEDDLDELGLDCADYISGEINGQPAEGHLIGTQTVTETKSLNSTVTVSGSAGPVSGSGSVGGSGTQTITYQVGFYKMHNNQVLEIDCRTYKVR